MTGTTMRLLGWLIGAAAVAVAALGLAGPAQAADGDFITTWNPANTSLGSSAANQIMLPLESSGTYNFSVDWGDGTTSTVTSGTDPDATHPYTTPADAPFTVTISGTLKGWRFNNEGDKLKILTVEQWGDVNFGNNGGYFYGCANLTSEATDAPDPTGTTDMWSAFRGASKLNGGLANWEVGNVTQMAYMFANADAFNENIGGWDTSKVTDMFSMFQAADKFNQDIGNWDTGNVTKMTGMFQGATAFNQGIGGWDTSNVVNMYAMFNSAVAFNQDIGGWDTSQVTDMAATFLNASAFNQDIGGWDTSQVTDMNSMFDNAALFNQDISNWDTSKASNMGGMFADAQAFNQDIGRWDTSGVTTMAAMFLNAEAFNQSIGTWDTSNVTDMSSMFQATGGNTPMFNQDISAWDTGNVTDMFAMFFGASAFNQDLSDWDVRAVISMTDMLSGSGLSTANYDSALIGWSGQAVQSSVPLEAQGIQYSCAAEAARQSLIDDHAWTISDAGLGPCASISPVPVSFDPTTVNQTTSTAVTVSNPGGADLILPVGAVTLTGTDASQFSLSADTCSGATVAAAGSCTVTVTFAPGSTGDKSAALKVTSNAVTSPNAVPLTGSGVLPGLNLSPSTLDFGSVTIGTSDGPQTVTVTNGGPGKLMVSSATVSGAGFAIAGDACTSAAIPAGAACTVQVSFTPAAEGAATGQLSFISNAPGSPHTVALTGTGTKAAKKTQTLKTKLRKRIRISGLTVITPKDARTNAGQLVRTIVRGGPAKPTAAGEVRYYTVVRGPQGKTSIRTYGYPNLRLKVTQRAPAAMGYTAFKRTATYTGGKRG